MKKKKISPYNKYINLNEEEELYKRICRHKNDDIKVYSNWKKHIIELLLQFKDKEVLDNYKHYLINCKRISKIFPEWTTQSIILIATMTITFVIERSIDNLIISEICLIIAASAFIIILLLYQESNKLSISFYKDIIEIIEEYQEASSEVSTHPNGDTRLLTSE